MTHRNSPESGIDEYAQMDGLVPGAYSLEIVDLSGKCGVVSENFLIEEPEMVVANFEVNKDTLYLSEGDILEVSNLSENADSYEWKGTDLKLNSIHHLPPRH